MHSEIRAQVAFRLAGLRAESPQSSAGPRGTYRPVLAARFRDLAQLRYDFPIILAEDARKGDFAIGLSELVDGALERAGADAATREAAVRLEREIRQLLGQGTRGSLQSVWSLAVDRLRARGDAAPAEKLEAVRKALGADGELADCDAAFAPRWVLHAWKSVQKRKAAAFRAEVERLIAGLTDVLKADESASAESRSAERLRETFGANQRDAFDFETMAQLLARAARERTLGESRRQRVRSLVVTLESQRFFLDASGYTFVFDRCAPALRAFRARYARLRSLARSLAIARLEIAGEYDEARHDALFRKLGEGDLAADELARFPDYLVCLRDSELTVAERGDLAELLASGVPAKILVQIDDLLEEAASSALPAIGARADAYAGLALGLGNVFVLQSAASNLPRLRTQLARALDHAGPALMSVYSGASGDVAALPPYLNAAAAMESRVFPAVTYDPSKDGEDSSGLSLETNPQPERDWPAHAFDFEDAEHQRHKREVEFTAADFLVADERFAQHFLEVAADDADVFAVDPNDKLQPLLAEASILEQVGRCRTRWRRLQRQAAGRTSVLVTNAPAVVEAPAVEEKPQAAKAEAPAAPVAEAPKAASSDDPYIETPRCTTCNECTQINNKLFAYDANKQAYIADASAGTYRQLVEAAESCQVSIIHPGKPRNPDEEGLEELLARAEPFR